MENGLAAAASHWFEEKQRIQKIEINQKNDNLKTKKIDLRWPQVDQKLKKKAFR